MREAAKECREFPVNSAAQKRQSQTAFNSDAFTAICVGKEAASLLKMRYMWFYNLLEKCYKFTHRMCELDTALSC